MRIEEYHHVCSSKNASVGLEIHPNGQIDLLVKDGENFSFTVEKISKKDRLALIKALTNPKP